VVVGEQDVYRVTHSYFPSPLTPLLYQVNVTVENISGADREVVYRRVMDWDIEPTEFDEYVTINAFAAGNLIRTSTDGFACSNPFEEPNLDPPDFVPGPVTDLGFGTGGPYDNGALFDFNFGVLVPGASRTFTTFYGAAGTEADAIGALIAVGAEIFSFGQPSTPNGPTLGTPNTFIFAFAGVGAPPAFGSCLAPENQEEHRPCTGEVVAFENGKKRMHFNTTYHDPFGNDHISEVKLRFFRPENTSVPVGRSGRHKLRDAQAEITLTYDVLKNQLRMEENIEGWPRPDDGDEGPFIDVCTPGQAKGIHSRMLNLDCSQTTVVGNEGTLKVGWRVLAQRNFKGLKDLLLWVEDKDDATDGFNKAGNWYSDRK
jgi:hypothetical protein